MSNAARGPESDRVGWTLGVDFGTVNTVAVLAGPDGATEPLEFDTTYLLSSTVFVTTAGALLAGRPALDAAETGAGWLVPDVKRQLGQDYLRMDGASVPPVEAAGAILRRVAAAARRRINAAPDAVAVGYPASWSRAQRALLIEAAVTAGLPEPVIVPEPVCVAQYIEKTAERPVFPGNLMAVYDFGGGHVDASLVRRESNGFRVIERTGLPYGGNDLDEALSTLATRQAHVAGPDVEPPGPLAARRARERLSVLPTVQVPVGTDGVVVRVEREDFEDEIHGQVTRTARMTAELIDGVDGLIGLFLTGGVIRTPLVANLYRVFGTIPLPVDRSDFAVAAGALLSIRPAADVTRLPLLPEQPSQDAPPVPAEARPVVAPTAPPSAPGSRLRRLVISLVAALATVAVLSAVAASRPDGTPPDQVATPALTAPAALTAPPPTGSPSPAVSRAEGKPSITPRATAPATPKKATSTPSPSRAKTAAPRPPSSPAFDVPATVTLIAAQSGLCITPDKPYDAEGAPLRLQTCTGDAAQQWRQQQGANAFSVLRNVATGKCLGMDTSGVAGPVAGWTCRDDPHQSWLILPLGSGQAGLQVQTTRMCLTSTQQYPGGWVELNDCGSLEQSIWRLSNN
ncbi:RICIN domain-containing protein [Micromonospora sp. NPDC000089]|uniref:RICIN domain-containing protein n=1 Tax=unclassified Micromonospora TaxID=2617518 RepID=UPI0036787D9E